MLIQLSLRSVGNSLIYYACWWDGCGFVTLVTIYSFLKRKCQTKTSPKLSTLHELYSDGPLFDLFQKYAVTEFSVENVYVFMDIIEDKTNPTNEMACKIYYTYLNGSKSELEVNVPGQLCQEIKEILIPDHKSDNLEPLLSAEFLFDKIQQIIEQNMSDTYSRFTFTQKYQKYMDLKQSISTNISND